MEKFGIFNILSTLNSLVGKNSDPPANKPQNLNSATADKKSEGAVFAPPESPLAYKPMLDIIVKQDIISKRIENTHNKQPVNENIVKKYKI